MTRYGARTVRRPEERRWDEAAGLPLALGQAPKLVTESYHVPGPDPGIQLYVRNKRLEGVGAFGSVRILLFVHGATYPAESSSDLKLAGLSWMDFIAQRAWDVYLMDVRGYGGATRPAEMEQPAKESAPIVHTDVAVRDVGAVVDHIRVRRGVSRINLLGWSWGTVLMGAYTAQNSHKVERLVLYAPLWLRWCWRNEMRTHPSTWPRHCSGS